MAATVMWEMCLSIAAQMTAQGFAAGAVQSQEALPHRSLSKCFSSIDQRHIDVGQINHMPVEAHLKTGCMLGTGKSGNRLSVLRNQFEHLDGADRSQQVLQLCFGC